MVLNALHLGSRREQVLQVPAPSGWVLARAPAACRCVVQHRLKAPAYARCCLGLLTPDRLEHAHHIAHGNCAHRHAAQHGESIGIQRVAPLLPVLGIAPAICVRCDIGRRNLRKCIQAAFGRPVPALVISSDRSPDLKAEVESLGYSFLAKPIPPAKIRAMIGFLLQPPAD